MANTSPSSAEVLDLFVTLLSEMDAGEPTDEFYSRLCEAVCRLAGMRRAVIFLYDETRREVRGAGSHGVPLSTFEGMTLNPNAARIVQQALAEDRVVESRERADRAVPEYVEGLLGDGTLICTPMSSGDRAIGVIVADRAPELGPLTDEQRHTLWTLGKACALAASARRATRQRERARQLDERLHLARELHDRVVHRLFGVSLALSGPPLGAEERERAREELSLALTELRAVAQAPLARPSRPTVISLHEQLRRLREADPEAGIVLRSGEDVRVPGPLESLAQSVLVEAVRNARKHAAPTCVEVQLRHSEGLFELEIVNDGVQRPGATAGIGLRLAAFEALEHGGLVEFGSPEAGRWRVRLAVPVAETAGGDDPEAELRADPEVDVDELDLDLGDDTDLDTEAAR